MASNWHSQYRRICGSGRSRRTTDSSLTWRVIMATALLLSITNQSRQVTVAAARPLWDNVQQAANDRRNNVHGRPSAPRPSFLNRLSTQVSSFVGTLAVKNSTAAYYQQNMEEELKTHHNCNATVSDNRQNVVSNDEDYGLDEKDDTLFSRFVASASDQIRTKLEQQLNSESTTSGFDWMGAVSTVSSSSLPSSPNTSARRRITSYAARQTTHTEDEKNAVGEPQLQVTDHLPVNKTAEMTVLDRLVRECVLTLGKIVMIQSFVTWVQNRVDDDWLQQLADRLLSEESATAVKTIRTILSRMEDHGIVDVFADYSPKDIAASLYALYRVQRAAIHYQSLQEFDQDAEFKEGEPKQQHTVHGPPEDLLDVLEDLSHYVVYATAAYGWKMDLAFKGKLHLGNEQALMRKTGVAKDDIIHLSLKSKAHLPVFFLVRDRAKKALVLCVRGTWSARDILTDLCCTAEEFEAPSSSRTNTTVLPQRYCAHHGMLEAAKAVATEMEDMIQNELEVLGPEYGLVLVGHSMGGGVVSLLATFWEQRFKNIKTYLFGGPCVAPLDSHPTNCYNIINVISEGDPFRCLSLGHVADISAAVAYFCENADIRRLVLSRADENVSELSRSDLKFCFNSMQRLRCNVMNNPDKMLPPGRIFHVFRPPRVATEPRNGVIFGINSFDDDDNSSSMENLLIHEVKPDFFEELVLSPRMFDISRHLPSLYEDTLRGLIEHERSILVEDIEVGETEKG